MLRKIIAVCSFLLAVYSGAATSPVHVEKFQGSSSPDFQREFFYFNAPNEDPQNRQALQQLASESKRHQQIIFIKPPENKAYDRALQDLVKASSEQKTHIYVLNKEQNPSALVNKLKATHDHRRSKPEVHFLKYKTPSQAQHIQNSITHQYGGSH